MGYQKGDARILQIRREGFFVPIGCLTSNNFEESVELIPTTTRISNGWKTYVPTNQDATISFDGLLPNQTDGILGYTDLKIIKRSRNLIEWRIVNEFNGDIDSGFGYITEIGESSPSGELITFSGAIQNYGEPSLTQNIGDLFQSGDVFLFQNGQGLTF